MIGGLAVGYEVLSVEGFVGEEDIGVAMRVEVPRAVDEDVMLEILVVPVERQFGPVHRPPSISADTLISLNGLEVVTVFEDVSG